MCSNIVFQVWYVTYQQFEDTKAYSFTKLTHRYILFPLDEQYFITCKMLITWLTIGKHIGLHANYLHLQDNTAHQYWEK